MTKEQLREAVGIAIGEASTCWENFMSKPPGGALDSVRASQIVDRLVGHFDQIRNSTIEQCAKCCEEVDPGVWWARDYAKKIRALSRNSHDLP